MAAKWHPRMNIDTACDCTRFSTEGVLKRRQASEQKMYTTRRTLGAAFMAARHHRPMTTLAVILVTILLFI